jgi:HEAT repeat protein
VEALALGALLFAITATLFVVVLIARRVYLASRERRQREQEEALRPAILALADGDEPGPELERARPDVVAELVARFARRLRGDARTRLGEYAERAGLVQVEVRRLRARRAWVRARAAFVLGDLGSTTAVEPLLAALDDDDREVRTAAARSLGRLGSVEAALPLARSLTADRVAWLVAGESLLAIGRDAVPALTPLLSTPDDALRARIVELVGRLGDAGHGELLVERLRDTSARVRREAARGLGRLGDEEATDALRRTLGDRVPFVRAAAAEALGAIGDSDSAEPLLELAQVDEFEPANAAAHALGRVDRALLLEAARDADASPHVLEAADLAAL